MSLYKNKKELNIQAGLLAFPSKIFAMAEIFDSEKHTFSFGELKRFN